MKKNLIFLLTFFFSFSVSALTESNISFVYKLLETEENFYKVGNFVGDKGKILKYAKLGKGTGSKGSLVFVSGRAENLFKYMELFYDLNLLGYSPIYTYDHRGQGFSERVLKNSKLGHVESYNSYKEDLKTFMETIVLQDLEMDQSRLFLISNSMGAAISILYLMEYFNKHLFKKAVFISPLVKLETKLPRVVEKVLFYIYKFICFFHCTFPTWDPNKTNDEVQRMKFFTDSQKRYNFTSFITKKYPKTLILDPTYQWVIETFKTTDQLLREDRVKKINIPLLLFQATQDELVSNKYQVKFCDIIPNLCHLELVNGKHELFSHKDKIRDKIIKKTVNFFQNRQR